MERLLTDLCWIPPNLSGTGPLSKSSFLSTKLPGGDYTPQTAAKIEKWDPEPPLVLDQEKITRVRTAIKGCSLVHLGFDNGLLIIIGWLGKIIESASPKCH